MIGCKDKPSKPAGLKVISEAMTAAMAERKVDGGIYLSRTQDGLANEIPDLAEGTCQHGKWIATTHQGLPLAMRWLRILRQLGSESVDPEIDDNELKSQIARIRTACRGLKNINSIATSIQKNANNNANKLTSEVDKIKAEIMSALTDAEYAINEASTRGTPTQ